MKRRKFIKKSAIVSGAAAVTPFHIINAKTKVDKPIIGHGDFKYRVHKDWGVQDFSKVPVKNCHEMVESRDGRLFMITDENKNNIIVYDKSGKVLNTWTLDLLGAHGLTISDEGDEEFLFITALHSHVVHKTTLDGKIVMTLAHPKQDTGLYLYDSQFMPSETAIAPNGDIYVVDGYGLQYIFKYDYKGNLLKVFGGIGGGKDLFPTRWTAHGLCFDYRDDPHNPSLVVAQRMENKFKWLDLEGKFIKDVDVPGGFVSRPVIHGDNLYTGVLNSEFPWGNSESGYVCILDKENKVVSIPGGEAPNYADGILSQMKGNEKHFIHPHDVCIDRDENVYVCQWNSRQTYPILLERV